MLTLERLRSHVVAALGRHPAGANGIEYLVNEAGQGWSNLKSWPYQSNARLTVPLVAGQTVYGLGPEFLELTALIDPAGVASERLLMSVSAFDTLRLAYPSTSHPVWSGTIYDGVLDGTPQKLLEMHPAPTVAGELLVVYRRGWRTVDTLDEAIELPAHLEPAFLAYLEAYARGRERKLPLHEAMEAAMMSPLVQDALRVDGNQIPVSYPRLGRLGRQYAWRHAQLGQLYIMSPYGPRLRTPGSSV